MSPRVAVCRKCRDHDCLEDFLRHKTDAHVDLVRCQKICNGPVAGLEIDGRMEWFERVSNAKSLAGLRRVIKGKPGLVKALRKRRVKKWSGRPIRT